MTPHSLPPSRASAVLWTAKYAPRSLDEVAGNDDARAALKAWALDWERGRPQKPVLLNGPPGSGKTAALLALAQEMSWSVVETNASDLRSAESIKKLAGLSSSVAGLFGNRRLLLFDEVDSAFDRGEVPVLLSIVKEAKQPVAFTANDVWEKRLAPLRALCKLVEFKRVNNLALEKLVTRVATAEGRTIDAKLSARAAGGDIRAALIDLQAGIAPDAAASSRERETDVFKALGRLFKAATYAEAVRAADGVDLDLDDFLAWVEENVSAEFSEKEDVAQAYRWLSRSNVFKGRIRRRQTYSLLKYVRALGLAGVAFSRRDGARTFVAYKYPSLLRRMGGSKESRALLKSAALKAGRKLHSSAEKAKDAFPWLGLPNGAAGYFELSDEEERLLSGLYDFKPEKRGQHE